MELEWDKLLLEIKVGQNTACNWTGTMYYLKLEWDNVLLEIRVGQTGTCNWSGTNWYLKLEWDKLLGIRVGRITT